MTRLTLIVLVAVVACSGDAAAPTTPGTPEAPVANAVVAMTVTNDAYNSFVPGNVFIVRNGTVTWNNGSGLIHNVTFDVVAGAPANVANFGAGSAERTFASSGTFNYRCTLHTGMTGVVRVE